MSERKIWGVILMTIGGCAALCLVMTTAMGLPRYVSAALFLGPSIALIVFGAVFVTVWRNAREQKTTSGLAIAAFVLGFVGFVSLSSVLPTMMAVFVLGSPGGYALAALGTVPAMVCGHMAGSRITASRGRAAGRGLARTGLIFGCVNIAIAWLVLTSPFQARALGKHYSMPCKRNMDRMEKAYREHGEQCEERFEGLAPGPDGRRPDRLPVARFPELFEDKLPACPLGGAYTVMRGGLPICSKHGDLISLSHD